jgi:hypothetical protein
MIYHVSTFIHSPLHLRGVHTLLEYQSGSSNSIEINKHIESLINNSIELSRFLFIRFIHLFFNLLNLFKKSRISVGLSHDFENWQCRYAPHDMSTCLEIEGKNKMFV